MGFFYVEFHLKRQIVYAGQVPLETDLLNSNKNIMVAIGHVLQDMIGTSTLFSGLGCVPTSPAGMTVNVNPGRAYSLQATDTGAYSSLSADARQVVKQGILLDAANFSCPAPTTAGFSVNYLIQGAFQEVDSGSLVLPYYNASNPSQAYNGPNGTGTSQTTARDNTVQLQVKAGVAATTGSQITPTPDAGFTGLWVVTVPFGASTITSTNISQYAGAPFMPASLLQMIQHGNSTYAVATGTANAHVAAFSPPITQRDDSLVLRYKAPAANTGALTFNDGLGAVAVVGAAHSALQGGETAANGDVWVQWNSSIGGGSYVMLDSTGGALQVAPATQPQHAVQLGQVQQNYAWNAGFQVVSATGTFTVPAGVYRLRYRVWGGGGGSGGCGSAGQTAGGAGGGGYSEGVASVTPGQTVSCTIGAAGTAGGAGGSGGTGGTTSFTAGALTVSATGGSGSSNGIGSGGNGAAGGTGSGGQNNLTGAGGCSGSGSTGGPGGMGGSAPQGGGGGGGATGTAQSGQTPGGGAGGPGAAGANPGAVGGAGRIVFEW